MGLFHVSNSVNQHLFLPLHIFSISFCMAQGVAAVERMGKVDSESDLGCTLSFFADIGYHLPLLTPFEWTCVFHAILDNY